MKGFDQLGSRRVFLKKSALAASALTLLSTRSPGAMTLNVADTRFQLSLHQYSLKQLFDAGELDLLRYASFAKETLGITNIEFGAEFCEALFADPKKAESISKQAERDEVTIRALLCADGNALDQASTDGRAAALKNHLQWAKVADGLGCDFIRVRASTEGVANEQLKHAVEGIGALCDALKSSRVNVLIENIAGHSRDPEWLIKVVEEIGRERVGLIADFGNFSGDLYAGMKLLLPYSKSVCTKSWEFDDSGNETKIDFGRMLEIIKDSDFKGCIAIEYLGDTPVAGIRKTADLLRRFCEI